MAKKVIIIGAGIAGLAAAQRLNDAGIEVVIFEKEAVPGGQTRSWEVDGERYPMGARIRSVVEGPDGALWVLEDELRDSAGRLLKLTPKD